DGDRTEMVSRCEFGACAGGGAPSGAMFLLARPDGSAVTFYSADQLLASAAPGGGIYRFDVATETLTFLTPLDTSASAGDRGGLLAASEDGSYLYLCQGGNELAVYHAGATKSIASIPCNAAGSPDGAEMPTGARMGFLPETVSGIVQGEPAVTPDAGYLFATTAAMGNGYPNEGRSEVYLYDAATETLRCLSCRADGAPPRADSFVNKFSPRPEQPLVSTPSPVSSGVSLRNLAASGDRAFFVSEEALVPADVDKAQDVYEWEAAGSGDCTTASAGYAAVAGGCVSLISSGDRAEGAVFEGASESGDDAFFASFASLVPADTGTELQLYDARVDGGLPAQHEVPPAPCGEAQACRGGQPGSPGASPAATAHYRGPGNSAGAACAAPRRQAKALKARAKAARRAARKARAHHQGGKAKRMEAKGRRLAAKAGRAARQAKRCTGADRRAAK
ncbi:MAG TPA: hypothetical protein VHA80_01905, partial [Solirubrobacterales bacterium]|nr:hypothetical protein [Solirubrobacterales bacterium]